MAMADGVEVQSVAISTTSGSTPITFEGGIQEVYIASTIDCYMNFDEPATTGSMLFKANYPPSRFVFQRGNVQKLYALTGGSTGTLYLTGIRY